MAHPNCLELKCKECPYSVIINGKLFCNAKGGLRIPEKRLKRAEKPTPIEVAEEAERSIDQLKGLFDSFEEEKNE